MGRSKLPPRRFIDKQTSIKSVKTFKQPRLSLHQHPPVEVFTSSNGIRSEILRLGISNENDESIENHLLLIPGNPGVIEYYRPLMRQLWRRLSSDTRETTSIHAIGLPGHDLRELNGTRTFGLNEHVYVVREYIGSFSSNAKSIVFLGHSYGSFLAARVASEMPDDLNYGFGMLMPCMWQMGRCAGGAIRAGLSMDSYGIMSFAAWGLTAVLPASVRDIIVQQQNHHESVTDVSRSLIDGRRRGVYANICSLGRDEMRWILDPSEKELDKFKDRALLLWTENDKWCPPEARKSIEEAFCGRLQSVFAGKGVKHAFPLDASHTEIVAKALVPWICEILQKGKNIISSNGNGPEEGDTIR